MTLNCLDNMQENQKVRRNGQKTAAIRWPAKRQLHKDDRNKWPFTFLQQHNHTKEEKSL